jgi:hypothetical protein
LAPWAADAGEVRFYVSELTDAGLLDAEALASGDETLGDAAVDSAVRPANFFPEASADDVERWWDAVRVGYSNGFVIASSEQPELVPEDAPFLLRINGWGQFRHTVRDSNGPNRDLNQFQLKRARVVLAGHAFTPDFGYFVQVDGRSTSGEDIRILDYFLTYDLGHDKLGLSQRALQLRTGMYKIPFTMARWLSAREFEFADRSMASMYFDVNRSLACGLLGESSEGWFPWTWETAVFNGLVTGGAETGSSGDLDENFAFSGRLACHPTGEWGPGQLADFEGHETVATRAGIAFAASTIAGRNLSEFDRVRVVDSGRTLSSILPPEVDQYRVALFCVDFSWKYRGWSSTLEYYFRTIDDSAPAAVPSLFDHGFWLQAGKFVVPGKMQLLARWSRVQGDSGTLGALQQSAEETAGGCVWYFREQNAKLTIDATYLNGAPINSAALDIAPGDRGWLYRTQMQFAF